MKRDIEKAINNYSQWVMKQKTNKGALYCSDGMQLIERATKDGNCSVFLLAMDSLYAGFWIGYTAGKREAAKKAKG